MKMKIGDKVKFLRETGGGVISGFRDKNIVLVQDEDGFEIPVPVSDVVPDSEDSYEGGTWGKPKAPVKAVPHKPEHAPEPQFTSSKPVPHPAFERREGEKVNMYLAFIPNNPDNMVETTFDTYIINDSNYFSTVTYLCAEGNAWKARFGSTIEPNTKEFVEEISRSQLDEIARVAVQALFYKRDKAFSLKPATSVEMRIDGSKFYKSGAFKPSPFFTEPALVIDVVKDDTPVKTMFVNAAAMQEALMGHSVKEKPKRPAEPLEQIKDNNNIEVNLHAYALFDSTDGLSASDILNRQLQKMNEVMEKHKKDTGRHIIFIHGKGDGVLRTRILRELSYKYPSCRVQDASFREYGYGATLVIIG